MAMTAVIFLILSVVFNMLSNSKNVVKKYEFDSNNRMSYSLFNLYGRYKATLNKNYRQELKVSIIFKGMSFFCLLVAFVVAFW
jgi:hypothetical protein